MDLVPRKRLNEQGKHSQGVGILEWSPWNFEYFQDFFHKHQGNKSFKKRETFTIYLYTYAFQIHLVSSWATRNLNTELLRGT